MSVECGSNTPPPTLMKVNARSGRVASLSSPCKIGKTGKTGKTGKYAPSPCHPS